MSAEPKSLEVPNMVEIAKEDLDNTDVCNRRGIKSQIGSQRNSTGEQAK